MKEILEHIAKSLEDIASTLKTQQTERKEMQANITKLENILRDIQNDPFGLENQKNKALSEKASKQKG